MSKKPFKSRHRVPAEALVSKAGQIDEDYQRQIDRSMSRSESQAAKRSRKQESDSERSVKLLERKLVSERRQNRNRALNEVRQMIEGGAA